MKETAVDISIICPFYNEENMVAIFFNALVPVLGDLDKSYEIICINDGSRDKTLDRLIEQKKKRSGLRIIDLSRNFGKEAALTAGLDFSTGKVVIPIDSDLQDPPGLIKKLIAKWEEGFDVVLARRSDRSSDDTFKRVSAGLFYKLNNRISSTYIPENVGDFRLMSRNVVSAIQKMPENQRFMKGIFAWVGFKTATVDFERQHRPKGNTSFSFWRLWNFALDGVTGFSTVPLRVWTYIGSVISLAAFCYGSFTIIKTLTLGIDVPGYASLLTTILFLGGVQLIGIGVIGEYIGRMYLEAKRRPPYIVDKIY